jgi:chlorobactene glucosyltransferase
MKEIFLHLYPLSFSPLFIFALIAILNAFTFPRLTSVFPLRHRQSVYESVSPLPPLSILIPMRDESAIIAETVRSLLAQDYPNLEILILDDNSTDNSAEIARAAAESPRSRAERDGDPRLRVIAGKPLPPGWTGKAWACHQLSEQATGEYLLFTDADVRWEAGAVSALMAEARRTNADLLTVWPTQITITWSERLVVPLMAFSILAYLPVLAVHYIPWPVFAAANGQCLLFRRAAYQQIGRHAAIKHQIVDDMAFAYAIKRHRLCLRMADANDLIQTRMYRNWPQVRDGFAKNILAGHGNSVAFLLFSTVFHCWLFILPWFQLASSLLTRHSLLITDYCLLITASLLTRALTAATSRQRVIDSLFMPVSVFLMTIIAFRSIRWRYTGGPQWKGRIITQ